MDFDARDVLRRAWQITWNHKVLWFFSALPMVPVILYVPIIGYYFLSNDSMSEISSLLKDPTLVLLIFLVIVLTGVVSFLLQVFGRSAITFGTVQLANGQSPPTFGNIFEGGWRFLRPMLGAMLLAGIGTILFLTVFSGALTLVGFVTFGLGSVVGQFLFFPATLLVSAVIEQSQTAIVADAISPTDAIRHAWELVKENLGIFALVTIVLYIGLAIISGIAALPVTAPLFVVVVGRFAGEIVNPSLLGVALSCLVAFIPLYILVQAILMVYVRSVHVITYLRLTRRPSLQPLPRTGEGTS